MANLLLRLRTSLVLALIASLWCWLLTALHGIWSFGYSYGYLNGKNIPSFPSLPVTYTTFFLYTLSALVFTFILCLILCLVLPKRFYIYALSLAWLVGGYLGATELASIFRLDFGTTWRTIETFFELFFHPLATPIWLAVGLFGTASLTQSRR